MGTCSGTATQPISFLPPFDSDRTQSSVVFALFNHFLRPGAGCSKLTMSLVNETLKFQALISEICQYFLLKNVKSFGNAKAFLVFSTKNISVFIYKVVKHLTS